MKVIVIVVVAIAVVFGVLFIPYCISKRTKVRGNISFSDPFGKDISRLFSARMDCTEKESRRTKQTLN